MPSSPKLLLQQLPYWQSQNQRLKLSKQSSAVDLSLGLDLDTCLDASVESSAPMASVVKTRI